MVETFSIDLSLSKEEKYKNIFGQIDYLFETEDMIITSLANFTAILKQSFDTFSWIGFYLLKNDFLYLGPFQGKIACTRIEIGKGVCGTSAKQKVAIIVPDVNQFPGHIACDSESKSEIVIPLLKNNTLLGVLDIDSTFYNNFDEIDKLNLEKICDKLLNKVSLESFILV